MTNVLGLLFEISADPSKAQRALEHFRAKTGGELNSVKLEFEMVRRDLTAWGADFRGQLSAAGEALASFREAAGLTFERFAQGMGMNMTLALLYSKSISEAMATSLRATVTAIAAESVVQALRSLGLAFYLLAIRDLTGAANAFKSAAVWGSIGSVAGAMAAALPGGGFGRLEGPRAGPGLEARYSTSGAGGAGGGAVELAPGSAMGRPTGNLTVLVVGEAQAARWLTEIINAGVERQQLRLVASHTKRSAPAGH